MPGGRPPKGPELVEGLEGSPEAKERLRVALETITGEKTIGEACQDLGVKEATVHELRARALQAAVRELEPKEMGRPRKEIAEAARVAELEEEIAELRRKLTFAELKADLQGSLAKRVEKMKEPEKKTKGRP